MSTTAVHLAVGIGHWLPAPDVRTLAAAVQKGPCALQAMRATAAGASVRDACHQLLAAELSPEDRHLVAGALLGTLESDPRAGVLDVVWTGPGSGVATSRLTSAVVVDLIDQAKTDVLLVGYAVHTEPTVHVALEQAHGRGVAITLLLERHADNPAFSGAGDPFPGLAATRLSWLASVRPAGASLHAKVLVVDGTAALIGSANVTSAALERNLECGLLVSGGPEPAAVRSHIRSLVELGVLR